MNKIFILVLAFGLNAHAQSKSSPGEDVIRVRDETPTKRSKSWLTALYLRPIEEQVVNQSVWPLVPALLLEGTPTLSVNTPTGPKTIGQLKKGDVLYRYEPTTQQVSVWEVGIVKRKSRRAGLLSSLVGANDGFVFENRVAMDQ